MTHARTEQQIMQFGDHLMQLFDETGTAIVTAQREPDKPATWTVSGGPLEDVTIDVPPSAQRPRHEVVNAMCNRAQEIRPGRGLSTLVPYGLRDLP